MTVEVVSGMETPIDSVAGPPGPGADPNANPDPVPDSGSGSKMDCTTSSEPACEIPRETCSIRDADAAVGVVAAAQSSLPPIPTATDASRALVSGLDSMSNIPGLVDELIDSYRHTSLGASRDSIPHSHPPTTLAVLANDSAQSAIQPPQNATPTNIQSGGTGGVVNFPVTSWPSGQPIAAHSGPSIQGSGLFGTTSFHGNQYQPSAPFANPQVEGFNSLYMPYANTTSGMAHAQYSALSSGGFGAMLGHGSAASLFAEPITLASRSKPSPSITKPPQVPMAKSQHKLLRALDMAGLSPKEAVFFFLVLAIQKELCPRIEYREYFDSKWVVRLTLTGETLEPLLSFDTKWAAKVHVSREGLSALMVRYPDWTLPDIPRADSKAELWSWSNILQSYCDIEKLPRPNYTGHPHNHGDRYEVKVCGMSFFGIKKFYATVTEAIHGSAHNALYCILASEGSLEMQGKPAVETAQSGLTKPTVSFMDITPLPENPKSKGNAAKAQMQKAPTKGAGSIPKVQKKKLPAKVSSTITKVQKPSGETSRKQSNEASKKCRRKGKAKCAPDEMLEITGSKAPTYTPSNTVVLPSRVVSNPISAVGSSLPGINPNLTTLGPKRRFETTVPVPLGNPSHAPKLTVAMIRDQLGRWSTNFEKVEKLCKLMGIRAPEYRISQTQEDFRNGQASAAAYFHEEPYLSRVGAIGAVKNFRPKEMAKEACAAEVVAFLTKIVEEDEYWTAESQQTINELGLRFWEERSELLNTSQRLLQDAPSPMLTDKEEGEIL